MSKGKAPHLLHLHSTFNAGGKEVRSVKLMNAFGGKARHSIVSAEPEQMDAVELISSHVSVAYPADFPSLKGFPWLGRLKKLAEAMKGYDLVLTYNWGAMDAVMAHTLFSEVMGLPPLIHHEDGFNEDEARKLKWQRNWFRKIALGRTAALVVPSRGLEDVALNIWQQPRGRVQRIPNGIDTARYAKKPKRDVLPTLIKHREEKWIGTLAGLRAVKDLPAMVRAFSALPKEWQLVILGEGPERAAIEAEAEKLGLDHRVHMPGFAADPAKVIGLFDIFALSSRSEQFPISVVEAMAAGLPVAAPKVGDIGHMVSEENAGLLAEIGDEGALADAFCTLAEDAALRNRCGEANRDKAVKSYDEASMVSRYGKLYASAMGRPPLG